MKEIWKDIEGYEGFYQVSNIGRVRSLDRIVKGSRRNKYQMCKSKMKVLDRCNKRYSQISIYKDGKGRKFLVHRLVAIAFIPNKKNHPQVNHLDFDRHNNHVSNLEWTDAIGNAQHAVAGGKYKNGLKGEDHPGSILTVKNILHIRKKKLRSKDYCALYNIEASHVTAIWKRKIWKHVS